MKYSRPYIEIEFQHGPTGEVGKNGCQLRDVVQYCLDEINRVDAQLPCRENALVKTKLEEALHWLDHRTTDRLARGVEGQHIP